MAFDRKTFFAEIRRLFGPLKQGQVNGFEAILTEWEKRGLSDVRHLAYMLATAWHETARTMQPIREYGRGRGMKYGKPGKHGQVAYGRGYVQITWDYNYERADKELGLNGALTKDYELALRPDIAAAIMFEGMAEGWFTGKKLSDYIRGKLCDYRNARRIINGTDKAVTIAGYAVDFEATLKKAEVSDAPMPEHDQPVIVPAEPPPSSSERPTSPSEPVTEPIPPPAGDGLGEPEPMDFDASDRSFKVVVGALGLAIAGAVGKLLGWW